MKKKNTHTTEEEIATQLGQRKPWSVIKKDLHVGFDRISRVAAHMKSNNGSAPAPLAIGRPQIVNPHIFTYIETETLNKPTSGSHYLANQLLNDLNVKMSPATITKIRNLLKFRYRKPRTTQNLTEKQIQNRINFCTTNLTSEIDWSSDVLISDESRFAIGEDSRRRWIRRGVYLDNTFCKKSKFTKSIMVWACIGKNYKSPLIFITGNLNTEGYIELLQKNEIFPTIERQFDPAKVFFQQDGATSHTSKASVEFIKQNINLIENWPSNSPDLSPIENLWGIIKHALQEKEVSSLEELKIILIDEWNKIDMAVINSLIESMPKRMELCLENEGKQIGHLLHKLKQQRDQSSNIHVPIIQAPVILDESNENNPIENLITPSSCTFENDNNLILSLFSADAYETRFDNQIIRCECLFRASSILFKFVPSNFEYTGKYNVIIIRCPESNLLIIRNLNDNFSYSEGRIHDGYAPVLHCQGGVRIVAPNCMERSEILYVKFQNLKIATKFHQIVLQSITNHQEKENDETTTNK
jgi:transposase